MSTISHPRATVGAERPGWRAQLLATELWASLAITAIWIAVAASAVWGPDFVSSTPGGTTTTIPSGVFVGLFACIGTWAVAKYGLGRNARELR